MGDGGVAVHRVGLPGAADGFAARSRCSDAAPAGSGIISIAWQGHCSKQTAQPVQRSKSKR